MFRKYVRFLLTNICSCYILISERLFGTNIRALYKSLYRGIIIMRTSERKSMKRRVRRAKRLGFIAGVLSMLLIIVASFGIGCFYSTAKSASDANKVKCYKSIQIECGDSLWSISEEYMDESYESIYDYMAELVELNQLESYEIDHLQEDDYLTISYYE